MNRKLELVIVSLAVASVGVAIILDIYPLSESQSNLIYTFDSIVVVILAVDFYFRMKASGQGLDYLKKNWYEIPAMIPLILFAALESELLIIAGALRALRLIRLIRLVRLVRIVNLFRSAKYLKKGGFIYFVVLSSAALIFGSISILYVEKADPKANIKDIGDAFWFSFTTMTITGYGDFSPVTDEGKIIAALLIIVGIAVILGFISHYGATLVQSKLKNRTRLANETKMKIKEKIDAIEELHREDVYILVGMITSLHDSLQRNFTHTSHSSSVCVKCGNAFPENSAFCNKCGLAIR
jgi:voltage-gated potassium channel